MSEGLAGFGITQQNIFGPYERKVVMDQGSSIINGPHQGAWVDTKNGECWFLHFRDKAETPVESDEFNGKHVRLQWQANPKPFWAFPFNGRLRLFTYQLIDSIKNYWDIPNLLLQKFPAEEFMVTTKLSFHPRLDGERAGLIIFGADYAYLSVVKKADGNYFSYSLCKEADKGKEATVQDGEKITNADIYLRVKVSKGAIGEFSYSLDGIAFKPVGEKQAAKPGRWVGAKVGLFCTRTAKTNDSGFTDVDWFRIEPIK